MQRAAPSNPLRRQLARREVTASGTVDDKRRGDSEGSVADLLPGVDVLFCVSEHSTSRLRRGSSLPRSTVAGDTGLSVKGTDQTAARTCRLLFRAPIFHRVSLSLSLSLSLSTPFAISPSYQSYLCVCSRVAPATSLLASASHIICVWVFVVTVVCVGVCLISVFYVRRCVRSRISVTKPRPSCVCIRVYKTM